MGYRSPSGRIGLSQDHAGHSRPWIPATVAASVFQVGRNDARQLADFAGDGGRGDRGHGDDIGMVKSGPVADWDGAIIRKWLESRILAARADQVSAERSGREGQDDCDAAAAEEMICASFKGRDSVDSQGAFLIDLNALLNRDEYAWRGVYNDSRFDRHARSYIRKLIRMAKANAGFERLSRYQ